MTEKRPQVGVACLVIRDGRVLLVRHKRGSEPGSWSPPGGHLDFGETPEACAARETLEETGVRVDRVTFFGITNDLFDEAGRHYVTLWHRAEAVEGEPRVSDPAEISDVGWFELSLLPTPLFRSFVNLLAGRTAPAPPGDLFQR